MKTTRNSYLKTIRLFGLIGLSLIAGATMPVAAQSSQIVITPAPATTLAGNIQPVTSSYGHHVNPRIDCNRVSYTFDNYEGSSTIHYFDIATGIDNVTPSNTLDRLSDIKGTRVAFTELSANGDQILVYDTVSHTLSAVPGFHRTYPRMGGNILAFWQFYYLNSSSEDEIGFYDFTTGAVTLLTNDNLPDDFPAISPSGDVIVWRKCSPDKLSCHIYSATRSSTGEYVTQALTSSSTGTEEFPQSDGNIVSYISNKSGDNDIYYQPVGGGTETHIVIPGDQREPTISANLLSFESNQTGSWEVFVYDLNSGILYQVTTANPPPYGSLRTLNHISVCNGTGRIVYSDLGVFGDFDISLFTFQPPDPPNGRLTDLITLVRGFELPHGTQTSLVVKLQDAIAALNTGDTATACLALADFISEVNAQSGKKLTVQQAQQLIQSATSIRGLIGCG